MYKLHCKLLARKKSHTQSDWFKVVKLRLRPFSLFILTNQLSLQATSVVALSIFCKPSQRRNNNNVCDAVLDKTTGFQYGEMKWKWNEMKWKKWRLVTTWLSTTCIYILFSLISRQKHNTREWIVELYSGGEKQRLTLSCWQGEQKKTCLEIITPPYVKHAYVYAMWFVMI